jgi:hypothetical protein
VAVRIPQSLRKCCTDAGSLSWARAWRKRSLAEVAEGFGPELSRTGSGGNGVKEAPLITERVRAEADWLSARGM